MDASIRAAKFDRYLFVFLLLSGLRACFTGIKDVYGGKHARYVTRLQQQLARATADLADKTSWLEVGCITFAVISYRALRILDLNTDGGVNVCDASRPISFAFDVTLQLPCK